MRLGLGKLQIRPTDFWDMSFQEFFMAVEGFSEFHSGGKPPPLSQGELEDMMERYPD